jgi:regulator of ribonuclease activity A
VTELSTADLVDRYGDDVASIPVQFRSFGRKSRFAGLAVTVKCFEDNALLKSTLAEHPDPSGKVLVVDGGGSLRSALVGDLIAGIALQRGWAGLIIWGAVRDSVALDLLDLGIKALGTNPQKSSKTGHGVVNGTIEIGGVWIAPGQSVHSDEDGIVVLGSHSRSPESRESGHLSEPEAVTAPVARAAAR